MKVALLTIVLALVPGASTRHLTYSQEQPLSSVVGLVTALDRANNSITIKTDQNLSVTIKGTDSTLYLRVAAGAQSLNDAAPITFAGIAAGDRVLVRGNKGDSDFKALRVVVLTKDDLAKRRSQELEDWKKRGVAGVVKSVNAQSSEISIQLRGASAGVLTIGANGSPIRRYTSGSITFEDAKASALNEISVGDQLRALGDKSDDGKAFKAQAVVFGSFKTIGATITAVDLQTGELSATTLEQKKPLQIKVIKESLIHRIPASLVPAIVQRVRPPATPPAGPSATQPSPQNAGGDVQQLIDALPSVSLSELKAGDVVSITGIREQDETKLTAIKLVAGVDAVLRALTPAPGRPQVVRLSAGLPNAFDFSVIPIN
jgi:hypothetical protein